jgi:hypothetical protein
MVRGEPLLSVADHAALFLRSSHDLGRCFLDLRHPDVSSVSSRRDESCFVEQVLKIQGKWEFNAELYAGKFGQGMDSNKK